MNIVRFVRMGYEIEVAQIGIWRLARQTGIKSMIGLPNDNT